MTQIELTYMIDSTEQERNVEFPLLRMDQVTRTPVNGATAVTFTYERIDEIFDAPAPEGLYAVTRITVYSDGGSVVEIENDYVFKKWRATRDEMLGLGEYALGVREWNVAVDEAVAGLQAAKIG